MLVLYIHLIEVHSAYQCGMVGSATCFRMGVQWQASVLLGLNEAVPQLGEEVPLYNSIHILLHARDLLPAFAELHNPDVFVDIFPSSSVYSCNQPHGDLTSFHVFYGILYFGRR